MMTDEPSRDHDTHYLPAPPDVWLVRRYPADPSEPARCFTRQRVLGFAMQPDEHGIAGRAIVADGAYVIAATDGEIVTGEELALEVCDCDTFDPRRSPDHGGFCGRCGGMDCSTLRTAA